MFVEPVVALPDAGLGEEVIEDYRAIRMSLKRHPMALLRSGLGHTVAAAELEHREAGSWVTVAGLVICRQRPGTASGVIFMTLEDETGMSNLIVWPKVFERYRKVVLGARVVGVTGNLQREGIVLHIVAGKMFDLSARLGKLMQETGPPLSRIDEAATDGFHSRDFH